MFNKLLIPVDLAHIDQLGRSLKVAAEMAEAHRASLVYVGVTATTPGPVARTPQEYHAKLTAFAEEQARLHDRPVSVLVKTANDPVASLDDLLIEATEESGADLVVMATHLPRHLDAIMPSHGGKIAANVAASVFLVRNAD